MYFYEHEYELRYTDADLSDNIKLSSLLSVLEEAACYAADEMGIGYKNLIKNNLGFVIVNWDVKLNRPIKLGEKLTIKTWPIKPMRVIVFRDFEIFCGKEKVGAACGRWCLVDLDSFSTVSTSAVFDPNTEYSDRRAIDSPDFKIAQLNADKPTYSKLIKFSDYDHYNHVNNTKYADFLVDGMPYEKIAGKAPAELKVAYVKQTKLGELLEIFSRVDDNEAVAEGKVGAETRVRLYIKFL